MPQPLPPMRVLLANEPRAYREALAAAFRASRPDAEVVVVDPGGLDDAVALRRPVLVVCSDLTEAVEAHAPVWALLYPDGARLAVSSVAGERQIAGDIELDGLLVLADQGAALAQAVGTP